MSALRSMAELRVVSLAGGLPGGLMVKFLVEAGAQVTVPRPAGTDPFATVHPAHPIWLAGSEMVDETELASLLAAADLCLVGGEDHPDAPASYDAAQLSADHPRLVVVDIRGLETAGGSDVPRVELLVQAAMGLTGEHRSGAPLVAAMHPGGHGAALLGLLGGLSALVARERTGRGQVVTTSYEQGVALTWSQLWMDAVPHDKAFDVVAPRDLQHLILRCRDGEWLQFTYGVPGAVRKVYGILGLPTDASEADPGAPRADRGPQNYYGMYDELAAGVADFDRDDLLERLREAGIPAEPVLDLGESWDLEQTRVNDYVADGSGVRHIGPTVIHRTPPADAIAKALAVSGTTDEGAPLAGLRVLDFGTLVAGPYASTLLSGLGATVTKVESATARASAATVRNAFAVSPGKRSLCLDLKAPGGAEVLRALCAQADVVQHNFRVGAADRLGLDPQSIWALNPGATTLTTTAFGPVGPKAHDRGLDMVVAAMTGHQVRAGADRPTWYRAPAIDYVCGAMGAIGIVMSYLERLRHGAAPAVETSLLGAALFLQQDLVEDATGLHGLPRLTADGLGTSAWDRLYACSDGWIAVSARGEEQRAALLALAGAAAEDTEVAPDELASRIAVGLAGRPRAEVLSAARDEGLWAVACADDAWERLRARTGDASGAGSGMVGEVADATYGRVVGCFGPLVEFSSWSGPASPRPGLAGRGEHTDEVLGEAGLDADAVARLREQGVVA